MKAITKYQSNDGALWDSQEAAIKRDFLIAEINNVMAPLGEVPQAVKDGKGWLQHDLETVNTAKDGILELCSMAGFADSFPVFNNRGRDCHPLGIIGRILNDNDTPLDAAWSRFSRIDLLGREHQQPFYAYTSGPDASHVCIEDRRTTKP